MNHPFHHLPLLRLLALLFIAFAGVLPAREPSTPSLPPPKASAVDAAMAEEMQKDQIVGLAIGIIQNGRIVYLRGYGLADREKNIPVTTETLFRWASCTKPVAAVAALQLAEKGQLDLDADVRRYVPEFPDKGVPITPRQILCHQSGIVHYANGQVIATRTTSTNPHPYTDPVVSLDHFKESPLLFHPGEKTSYSSYAYVLLSAVIERAGKQKMADQVNDRIAKPLGMSTFQPDYQWANIPNRAVGYTRQDSRVQRSTDTDQSWKWGAGGYLSSVADFARFAEGLLNGRLIDKKTEAAMWEPQKTSDGEPSKFGLGVEVQMKNGQLEKISHNGSQEKTRTRFVIYPSRRDGVVVMTNCEWIEPGKISTAVYSALARP